MKKLFLLDAMALIYRAHFAFVKNPRINSKGINTSAVFGFTNTLLEVIRTEKPTHIGVAFDNDAPTFRHQLFPAYKAHRNEQPEDITIAVPFVKELCRAFKIPVLELDGYEADDIIGTFAKKAALQGFVVYMMTPDKDYGQLVSQNIFLYKPSFMGNSVEILGVNEVCEKWGIERVEQVTDLLGMMGDAVDNIPGIPGIGEKTASKLLQQFGSLENLLANAEQLKGKQKESVIQFAEQAILSKKLATICTEVPLEFDEKKFEYHEFDRQAVQKLFHELEFRTLAQRLLGEGSVTPTLARPRYKAKQEIVSPSISGQMELFPESQAHHQENKVTSDSSVKRFDNSLQDYWLIDTVELCRRLADCLAQQKEFCFDTETTSLSAIDAELVGLSFAYIEREAYYVPLPAEREEALKILEIFKPVFENESIAKIGQNLKYDMMILMQYGIELKGKLFDTMLAHYLIDPDTRHNMDVLAVSYLNYQPIQIEELIGKKGVHQGNMRDVPLEKIKNYAAEDADITLRLKHKLEPQLVELELVRLFEEIEIPLIEVLAQTELNGVRIDPDVLHSYSKELQKEIEKAERAACAMAGAVYNATLGYFEIDGKEFKLNSPKQLGEVLFERLKIVENPKKTKTGQYATDEETLMKLAPDFPVIQAILEYRQLQKLKSTYVDALPLLINPKDGLIHTSYNQAVAATGRLSSQNPNLQNIPIRTEKGREIRKAFIPRSKEYILMSADYSQIELRIMASFSQDQTMIQAFKEGKDIHAATASKIFKVPIDQVTSEMRRKAKTANFGIIYGISAHGLSQRLNIPRREAAELIDAYFQEFPAIKRYIDNAIAKAHQLGYVETILGRRRYLRDIHSANKVQVGYAERNAINAPIQGSAADLIKKAMIDIHRAMKANKMRSKMIMQVHDELVFDVYLPEKEQMRDLVVSLMENALKLDVPIVADAGFGENWLEAH
ncbi:MAG: DNA polymerase I [Cytophagales bacterium]|nr:DNA polymerase I [Cytophagales bacterium]MDW8383821.1 DNA polymerase I [Flammeovirgaceae bacterium]